MSLQDLDINQIFGQPISTEEIEEDHKKNIGLFDFLNAINHTKEDIMVDDVTEKAYVPFLINKGLSFAPDTVIYANEMNYRGFLDKKMQFDFLKGAVRAKKRFNKWIKPVKIKNIEIIKQYYGFSNTKAYEALAILTDLHIRAIEEKLYTGGSKPFSTSSTKD